MNGWGRKSLLVVFSLACLAVAGRVDAGVRGNTFDTDFDSVGDTYQAFLAFDASGRGMTYDGEGGVFAGSYIELNLGIFSVFTFNLDSADFFGGFGFSMLSQNIHGVVLQLDHHSIDFNGVQVNPRVKPNRGPGGANAPSK